MPGQGRKSLHPMISGWFSIRYLPSKDSSFRMDLIIVSEYDIWVAKEENVSYTRRQLRETWVLFEFGNAMITWVSFRLDRTDWDLMNSANPRLFSL